jgi:hypothetical protein
MQPISIIGLFCEDIRQEKSEQATLIGILPDNLAMPQVPNVLPKLGVYIRVHFDPKTSPSPMSIKLRVPDGPDIPLGEITDELITQSKTETKANGTPVAGLVSMAVVTPFPIKTFGNVTAVVTTKDGDYICAALNIIPTK